MIVPAERHLCNIK